MDLIVHEVDMVKSIRSANGMSCVLHDVVHEAVFRTVNGLQLAKRICGFVGIICNHITLVLRHERHDTFLYVFFCCTMADVWMDMEHSNGGKRKISSGNMAGVVG